MKQTDGNRLMSRATGVIGCDSILQSKVLALTLPTPTLLGLYWTGLLCSMVFIFSYFFFLFWVVR